VPLSWAARSAIFGSEIWQRDSQDLTTKKGKQAERPAGKRVSIHTMDKKKRFTRDEKKSMKKSGDIRGYFGLSQVGRPKAPTPATPPSQVVASMREDEVPSSISSSPSCSSSKRPYSKWVTEDSFKFAKEAVIFKMRKKTPVGVAATVPRSTVNRFEKKMTEASKSHGVSIEDVSWEMVSQARSKGLFSSEEVRFLTDIVTSRDKANRPMSRNEVIQLMMEMKQTSNQKKCENHYDYLIQKKRMPELKRFGRVTTAQATTIKRSQMMKMVPSVSLRPQGKVRRKGLELILVHQLLLFE